MAKEYYHAATISDAINWDKDSKSYGEPYQPIAPEEIDGWKLVSACAFGDKVIWYWVYEREEV